jgi:hypothetical protein
MNRKTISRHNGKDNHEKAAIRMTNSDPQSQMMRLDSSYLVTYRETNGKLKGEVVREDGRLYKYNTLVFHVPEQPDEEALMAWAERALQAYREG